MRGDVGRGAGETAGCMESSSVRQTSPWRDSHLRIAVRPRQERAITRRIGSAQADIFAAFTAYIASSAACNAGSASPPTANCTTPSENAMSARCRCRR